MGLKANTVGTFDALAIGDTFRSPARKLDSDLHRSLVELGGYVHPLFTDAEFLAASPFDRAPFPGQALLLVMGGLVEATGRFDDSVIALVGFDAVRFLAPALADGTVHVDIEVVDKEQRSNNKGLLTMVWRCANERDEVLAEATARMLFKAPA